MTSASEDQPVVEFLLAEMTLDNNPTVPLTEAELIEIRTALDNLDEVMVIEEAFDAIMMNYRIYEEGQMRATLDHVLDTEHATDHMTDVRRRSALHLDNLLSSARAFLDITPSRMKKMGGPDLMAEFKRLTSVQYDAIPAYQFMEALRNYAQHEGSSVTGMRFDISRSDKGRRLMDKDFKMVFSVQTRLHSELIRKHFKAHVRHLIDTLSDKKGMIDMTPLVRAYIVGLNNIILETRALLKEREEGWYAINQQAIDRLKEAGSSTLISAAIKRVDGRVVETNYLAPRHQAATTRLRKRNGKITHLLKAQING
ncbi:hypothetical protein D3C72_481100 [compost metagenome]